MLNGIRMQRLGDRGNQDNVGARVSDDRADTFLAVEDQYVTGRENMRARPSPDAEEPQHA